MIQLQGGTVHITQNNTVYEIITGHVLVYLMPYTEGKTGRRLFLTECAQGEKIPGFQYSEPVLGDWCIGLTALDDAEVRELPQAADEELKYAFAEKINIRLGSIEEYDEQLIEKYNINIVKEEGYIYAAAVEQSETYEKGLGIIYDLFRRKRQRQTMEKSGNRMYDTVAYLCGYQHIPIVSFATIRENCGRRFTLEDISRVSHFITREIVLEEKWYRRDSGPFLAYLKESHKPIACIPISYNRYAAYDVEEDRSVTVDAEYAAQLEVKARMFYRPFPNKEMKIKDLFCFGMQSVNKGDIARFIVLACLGTLIGLLIPYMNEKLYDNFIPMGNANGLVQVCSVILACTLGNITFTIVKNLATFRSVNAMAYAVQSATYDRLFNLPQGFLEKYNSADLAQRAMGISAVYNKISDVAIKSLLSAVFSLLYLWRMFSYSPKLCWSSLILLVVSMLLIVWIGIRQTKYEREKLEKDIESRTLMNQLISGISKIRIAGVENRALYEYLKPYVETRRINIRKEKMTVFVNAFAGGLPTVFSMIFYYLMVSQDLNLSVGAFMGFTSAFGAFSAAMLEIVSSLLQINDVKPVYDFCKPILETLPEWDDDVQLPGSLSGEIELNNVTFSYSEDTGKVIDNLSLRIGEGEYIGVVGSSGSGKSTLLKLLMGFEKPQLGKIYYDGRDIDSMDKRELRKKFGVVLQDGGLIAGSIYENITITAPDVKMERVQEVIEEVGLSEDIEAMPMGLHTVLSENSGTISGGQKQRILIARALIGRPKIIYFDEATSALDNVTQSMVVESLEKIKATKIVIAHRLSTVVNCDRILVLEHGQLLEDGNYEELMAKKGRFYELAIRQIS